MSCDNTNSTHNYYSFNQNPCSSSTGDCSVSVDTSCVVYTGANLTAIDADSNDTLEDILTKLNTVVGAISGIDWSDFDYGCLPGTITTAQQFVETVSAKVCEVETALTDFIETSYSEDLDTLRAEYLSIAEPELSSCSAIGVITSDNYSQILTKIFINLCSVNEQIDPSGADWNTHWSTDPLPETITAAFNVIIAQIGEIIDNYVPTALPVFNNETSCLDGGTSSDSLAQTIELLKTKVCEAVYFDINDVDWTTCIANPNPGGGADITTALSLIVSRLDSAYTKRVNTFDPVYFEITQSNPSDTCSGYTVSLKDDVGLSDKLVALEEGDTAGYLLDKLTAGDNVTFDTATTPGTLIIDVEVENDKVKASAADASSGYLIDKVEGKSDTDSALTLTESYNASTDKVDITPSFDWNVVAQMVIDAINGDATLLTNFCAITCESAATRTVSLQVTAGGADIPLDITMFQASPLAAWLYLQGATYIDGTTFNSGSYNITTSNTVVTGQFAFTNNYAGTINYTIEVEDGAGNNISGATNTSGVLTSGATLDINPFIYGDSATDVYLVKLTVGV